MYGRGARSSKIRSIATPNQAPAGPSAAPWLRWLGRCGFVAEGVIYLLVGGIALIAAFEPGEQPHGSQGALVKLARAPWGTAMVTVLALGLATYVLWQLVQAIADPAHRGDRWRAKRLLMRLGCLLNAVLYSVLVGGAAWRLFGFGGASDNGHAQAHWTALAMQLPFGRWAVAATGGGIALFGLFQLYAAATLHVDRRIAPNHPSLRAGVIVLGVLGLLARCVVFGWIGVVLLYAAWRYDAHSVIGIAGTLAALRRQAYGPWLLGAVAIGLMAYGMLQVVRAGYGEIRADRTA